MRLVIPCDLPGSGPAAAHARQFHAPGRRARRPRIDRIGRARQRPHTPARQRHGRFGNRIRVEIEAGHAASGGDQRQPARLGEIERRPLADDGGDGCEPQRLLEHEAHVARMRQRHGDEPLRLKPGAEKPRRMEAAMLARLERRLAPDDRSRARQAQDEAQEESGNSRYVHFLFRKGNRAGRQSPAPPPAGVRRSKARPKVQDFSVPSASEVNRLVRPSMRAISSFRRSKF